MTGLIKSEQRPERLEKFNSLQSGQYWRAKQDIPKEAISAGEVLLIQSLRWVENQLHTVVLRSHPKYFGHTLNISFTDESGRERTGHKTMHEHRFLFNDFVCEFEYAPDHKTVRDAELSEAQGRIVLLTQTLQSTLSNPEEMRAIVHKKLEGAQGSKAGEKAGSLFPVVTQQTRSLASGTLGNAIDARVTQTEIDAMHEAAGLNLQIAKIQSDWISARNNEISKAVMAVQPFFEEMAAAQLATMEDAQKQVQKLKEGIASLDLYILKGVHINPISEGASAPASEPLTVSQRKLMVDEELAVYLDVENWFDFNNINLFFDALRKHPALVEQVFPSQRCVVSFATTRRFIDYQDRWANYENNKENACVFLMVRDGERIFQVYSPVESHLGANNLFPSQDDQSRFFTGMDGTQIQFQDVTYSDRLSAHDKQALHYKRFLILLCGLDHKEQLFGEFYDRAEKVSFVSMEFQEKYMRFISDQSGEGLLDSPELKTRPDLDAYISNANAHMRSGARVLCRWFHLVNPKTAPGAIRMNDSDRYSSYDIVVDFKEKMSVAVVYERGGHFYVDAPVSKYAYSGKNSGTTREYNVKVCLTKFISAREDDDSLPFLCLDTLKADDLDYYVQSRRFRGNHLYYIQLFKTLSKELRAEDVNERPARAKLNDALVAGGIGNPEEHAEIIDKAVIAWRSANRGAPLSEVISDTKQWENLLDMMDMIAWRGASLLPAVQNYALNNGYSPLRLIVNAKGKLSLYVAPKDAERDDRAEPHKWVRRINFNLGAKGIKEASRSWALLAVHATSETTLNEWPESKDWSGLSSVFTSFEEKDRVFSYVESSCSEIACIKPGNEAENESAALSWLEAYYEMNVLRTTGGQVQHPSLLIPVGVFISRGEWNYLYLGTTNTAVNIIYHNLTDEIKRKDVADMFVSRYAHPEGKREKVTGLKGSLTFLTSKARPEMDLFCVNRNAEYRGVNYNQRSEILFLTNSYNTQWKLLESAAGTNDVVWLANAVRDENGEPNFDELTGYQVADNEPVDVIEVELPRRGDSGKQAVALKGGDVFPDTHWFDVCPPGYPAEHSLMGLNAPDHKLTRHSFTCLEKAVDWMLGFNQQIEIITKKYSFRGNVIDIPDTTKRFRFR